MKIFLIIFVKSIDFAFSANYNTTKRLKNIKESIYEKTFHSARHFVLNNSNAFCFMQ